MAAQGSTATNQTNCSHDVFLSFRGKDTRHSFTGHLYHALSCKGVKTFMDDEGLKVGDQISGSLVKAIQQSRISIVVLSENYASSRWCLDELVEILECARLKNQKVWPIFFKVEPSDVRNQRNSFAEAMAKNEQKFGEGSDKVQKWRLALSAVANLKGPHHTTGYEYELIEEIVKKATTELQCEQLDVGEHIIGHQSRLDEVKLLLDIESHQTVCMLGIHGSGGMGKTTLAKALYNSISHHFECSIFLEDVREKSDSYKGLVSLQEAILSKFEGKNIKLSSASEGVTRLKDILWCHRVLLVLDDVDKEEQLENLARKCDWFGLGSRIIITTRNKHVPGDHDEVAMRFEMNGLNDDEALQLFCWNAFKKSKPPMNYKEVSNHVVQYASGLPLALKVIGSHLAKKSVKGCEDALKQYEKIPKREIQDILKISYECLENPAKNIFLDIACFFKGMSWGYVEQVWEKCDFFPSYNYEILVDKSLIAIKHGVLWMHDLIQDMGKEIVRLEDPKNPSRRSRLHVHKDVLKVLKDNLGSDQIEGIMFDPHEEEEVNWNDNAFKKMTNLRILIIRRTHFTPEPDYLPNSLKLLDWAGCPSKSLPSGFDQIVVLSLPYSHLTLEEAKPFPKLVHLTSIDFSQCQYITHFPDASGVPNLSNLDLNHCGNLTAIHHSVGFLQKLKYLFVDYCTRLQDFLPRMSLPSLNLLGLSYTRIAFFPHIEERMCAPLQIFLHESRIKGLPDSVSNLVGLEYLSIELGYVTVGGLPMELFMLPNMSGLMLILNNHGVAVGEKVRRSLNSHALATTGPSTLNRPPYSPLRELRCDNCGLTDEDLHIILSCFPDLEKLYISRNKFVSLPASIEGSANLKLLDVSCGEMLEEIPVLPRSIEVVEAHRCPRLSSEAFKTLWSQVLNEASGLYIRMPRTTNIPDWFDHQCEGWIVSRTEKQKRGEIVSFRARRKFPVLAVAFVLEEHVAVVGTHIYINGNLCESIHHACYGGMVSVFDLRCIFSVGKWEILDTFLVREWNDVVIKSEFLVHEWNDVVIKSEFFYPFGYAKCASDYESKCECEDVCECECERERDVYSCGVYVYKQETNMEDIQFTCPTSPG